MCGKMIPDAGGGLSPTPLAVPILRQHSRPPLNMVGVKMSGLYNVFVVFKFQAIFLVCV